jgi:hypothetical protein
MLSGPVFAHDSDKLHGREKTGCVRKVRGRAPQEVITLGLRGFDIINSNRTNNEQRHVNFRTEINESKAGKQRAIIRAAAPIRK